MDGTYEINVNGKPHRVKTDGNRPLLDVLREDLGLTGTKYGCGEGECGACTVILDGQSIHSCITTISEVDGERIGTVEGLASGGKLHPVQQAFIEKRAMQCGYCVPGQIMSAVALLGRTPNPTRQEIVDWMDGNICRCCNYPRILEAVQHAAQLAKEAQR